MPTRRRTPIEDLRLAIDCLPRATRAAMLEAVASEPLIAGAYTSERGVCPMLAAHRRGGRTSLISFARAWDRFVLGSGRVSRPRPATARELLVLRSHLQASLLAEDTPGCELSGAIASHLELVARRRGERGRPPAVGSRVQPGDRYRARELGGSPGWAWMRVVRGYDEYERALAQVGERTPSREAAGTGRRPGRAHSTGVR
jgi:hypothetical protein